MRKAGIFSRSFPQLRQGFLDHPQSGAGILRRRFDDRVRSTSEQAAKRFNLIDKAIPMGKFLCTDKAALREQAHLSGVIHPGQLDPAGRAV